MIGSRYLSSLSTVVAALCFAFSPVITARAQSNSDQPFGLATVEVTEGLLSTTWTKVLREVNKDFPIIAHCRAEPSACSSPAALKFLTLVQEGVHQQGRGQIAHINRAANAALRSVKSPKVDKEWRPPLGVLAEGTGDCKHYAVLKYAALAAAGIAPDALEIVVVEVRSSHEQHAMVAVRSEGRWLLLDNRTSILIESAEALAYYDPLYVLDQDGVRQFALSHPAQIVARSDKPAY
jgi:predicted transglutaminase-like cysteine proteinase